MAFYFYRRNRM